MTSIKLDSDGNILDGNNRIRAMEEMKDLKEEMKEMKIVTDSGVVLDGNNRRRSTDGWTMEDYKKFFASNAPPARTEVIEMDDELLSKLID
jgi:hypothetical protein|tara:strand:- start:20 stop:292 length:273 start_codon:yes stop_codon:yes gene_type:complete